MILLPKITLLFFCLLGAAFFAGMEMGVVSLDNLRLQHLLRKKNRNALILSRFLEKPDRLFGTTLVGTNLCHITFSVTMASIFTFWFKESGSWIAAPLTTLILLIFGEYLPKSWMAARPARRALPPAPVLRVSSMILGPVGKAATKLASLVFPVSGKDNVLFQRITREDLVHLTHTTHKAGQLTATENRMINAVFALKGKTCADIMVPRKRMAYCHIDTPADKILELARARSVNRFPVYQPDSDSFTGIIYIFDVLKDDDHTGKTAADYLQPPQFVLGDTPVEQIIPRMRLTRQPFMMVTDKQNSDVLGIIALNEVLDRIMY